MTVPEVDRISITTVVDNYIDSLRQDGAMVRRFSHSVARKMPELRAEHGLAHHVEIVQGGAPLRHPCLETLRVERAHPVVDVHPRGGRP